MLIGTQTGSSDGYGQQAFFFVDGRFIGTDTKQPSATVKVLGQGDTEVTLAYPLYRSGDPLCSPSGGQRDRALPTQRRQTTRRSADPAGRARASGLSRTSPAAASAYGDVPPAHISEKGVGPMSVTIEGRGAELLEAKNFCHVSTLRADGSVHGVPVWVDVQDGRPCSTPPRDAPGRATSSAIRA